jgi:VWFA-related protein
MRTIAAVMLAGLCSLGIAARQNPPSTPTPPPHFRSGIDLIEVDVSVLDRKREPVRGVKAEEFTILEDGKPQPIRAFAEITVPDPVVPTTAWLREVAPDVRTNDIPRDRRLVVLLFDDAQVRVQWTKTVKSIGRAIVDKLGPGDLAAVVFTRSNRGAQEFTDDRAKLLAAIDKFQGGFGGTMGPGPAEPVPGMIGEFLSRGDPKLDYSPLHFYKQSLYTLRDIAKSLAEIPQRRKAVVWVSPGLPIVYTTADGQDLKTIMETVFREAERANVSIYPVDPGGLEGLFFESPQDAGVGSGDTRVSILLRENLMTIALNTGGEAIVDRNEFTSGVAQILRETGSYYLLGFQPANPAQDGKSRRLEIKVNRSDLTVSARKNYVIAKPDTAPETPAAALARAMSSPLPKGDLPMQVVAAPFAVAGRGEATLAIAARLQEPGVAERTIRVVELMAGAFDPQGSQKGTQRQTARITLLPSGGNAEFEVLTRIDLKPGRYNLRLAANDTSLLRSGSVYYDVEIPDFDKDLVALSGMVLSVSPGVPVAPRDALTTLLPVIPTTTRVFTHDDDVSAFVRIYQGGKKPLVPVQIDVRAVDTADRVVHRRTDVKEPGAFSVSREADYRLDLPLERFTPGQYVLTCEASAGGRTVRRDIRFTVK